MSQETTTTELQELFDLFHPSQRLYDLQLNTGVPASNGWKLSIQGKTTEDVQEVFLKVFPYLQDQGISCKVATIKRLQHSHPEQSKKIMTIYIPNDRRHLEVAEEVYSRIKDYKGWHDIKKPTSYEHYAGGVYFRNDRDPNGQYIKAN